MRTIWHTTGRKMTTSAILSISLLFLPVITFAQEQGTVTGVVDGDTFKIEINGSVETIRIIGIDTPETVHPSKPVQCFGKEASNTLKEVLDEEDVMLEKNPAEERDKYRPLLRYF